MIWYLRARFTMPVLPNIFLGGANCVESFGTLMLLVSLALPPQRRRMSLPQMSTGSLTLAVPFSDTSPELSTFSYMPRGQGNHIIQVALCDSSGSSAQWIFANCDECSIHLRGRITETTPSCVPLFCGCCVHSGWRAPSRRRRITPLSLCVWSRDPPRSFTAA